MISEFTFGPWLPDAPDYKNALIEADNVYPKSGGYGPFRKPVDQGLTGGGGGSPFSSAFSSAFGGSVATATTETVIGAHMFFDQNDNAVHVAGSSTRLLTVRSGTLTETTGYTAAADGWRFARFNDLVIAVSLENDPQYLTDINSDDTWSTLTGTPPKAAQVGRVDDFLVFGDLVDNADGGSATAPYRVRWSAKNNPTTSWVTDRGELSGYRDLDRRYGRITAIVGGRFGLIFQERAIWRMVFVGAPLAFDFELISSDRGCIASNSAVTIGTDTFFLSHHGFDVTNGSAVQSVGGNRIDDWFKETVSDTNVKRTHGAINWNEDSIVWAFYPSGGTMFTRQIIYNFVQDTWSSASQSIDYLVQSKVNGETLASLSVTYPGGLGDMSAFTLGSSEWLAKDLSFAAFIPSGNGSTLAEFSGTSAQAQIVTGESMAAPGRRATVTGAWPIVETTASTITTSIRTRDQHGGAVRTTTPTVKGADGFCPHKVDGWLHSVRMTIPEGVTWQNASGVQVRAQPTGRR